VLELIETYGYLAVFIGAFFEGMGWQQSGESGGWLQPRSTMYLVGLKTGWWF